MSETDETKRERQQARWLAREVLAPDMWFAGSSLPAAIRTVDDVCPAGDAATRLQPVPGVPLCYRYANNFLARRKLT